MYNNQVPFLKFLRFFKILTIANIKIQRIISRKENQFHPLSPYKTPSL